MSNQLYRTKKNAILGGVCQGLAEYLRLDVIWVRVYFFLLVLATGLGFLVYLALWVIMPREDHLPAQGSNGVPQPDDFAERFEFNWGGDPAALLLPQSPAPHLYWRGDDPAGSLLVVGAAAK